MYEAVCDFALNAFLLRSTEEVEQFSFRPMTSVLLPEEPCKVWFDEFEEIHEKRHVVLHAFHEAGF